MQYKESSVRVARNGATTPIDNFNFHVDFCLLEEPRAGVGESLGTALVEKESALF